MYNPVVGFGVLFAATTLVFVIVRWAKQPSRSITHEFFMIFPTLFLYGVLIDDFVIELVALSPSTPFMGFSSKIVLPMFLYGVIVASIYEPPRETPLEETELPESMRTENTTTTKPISDSVTLHNILEEDE